MKWHVPPLPDLSDEKRVALDIETWDPYLLTQGPGFVSGEAEVLGVAIALPDKRHRWYFPIFPAGGYSPPAGYRDVVVKWLMELLVPGREVVGANLYYDLVGLKSLGITCKAKTRDVQIAEVLLDEERSEGYSLDSLCVSYLGKHKEEKKLEEAARRLGIKGNIKQHMEKYHPSEVAEYAQADAADTLEILEKQEKRMAGLERVWDMESRLLPLLVEMHWKGVRVDLPGAVEYDAKLSLTLLELGEQMQRILGRSLNVWSARAIEQACASLSLEHLKTAKGNPSFKKDWLKSQEHPLFQTLLKYRELERLKNVFLSGTILKLGASGRIHPQWVQLRREDGGTRSGRMACNHPNLQQIPSRTDLGRTLRKLFLPDEEGHHFVKCDYSQQEPRILIHLAGSNRVSAHWVESLVRQYRENPRMDFYDTIVTASGLSRQEAKQVTLARCYGMGVDKLMRLHGYDRAKAVEIFDKFNRAAPWVRLFSDLCQRQAKEQGYVSTLLGRRRHFKLGPPDIENHSYYEKTYRALNAMVQGNAADMTKQAMLQIWGNLGLIPLLQVHDELCYSLPKDKEMHRQVERIMVGCLSTVIQQPLKVAMVVDTKIGETWHEDRIRLV